MGNHHDSVPAHELSRRDLEVPIRPRPIESQIEDDNQQAELEESGVCCVPKKKPKQFEKWVRQLQANINQLSPQHSWVLLLRPVVNKYKNKPSSVYRNQIDTLLRDFQKKLTEPAKCVLEPSRQKQLKQMLTNSVIMPAEINKSSNQSMMGSNFSQVKNFRLSHLSTKKNANGEMARNSTMFKLSTAVENGGKNTLNVPGVSQIQKQQQQPGSRQKQMKISMLMSFRQQNMAELFKQKQQALDKNAALSLWLFVNLTQTIQKHAQDPDCALQNAKSVFCEYIEGLEDAKVITDELKVFLEIYRDFIWDFEQLIRVSKQLPQHNFLTLDNFTNAVISILFKTNTIYKTVLNSYLQDDKQKQQTLNNLYEKYKYVLPHDVGVPEKYCLNKKTLDWYLEKLSMESAIENVSLSQIQESEPYDSAIRRLRQINAVQTPIAKLKVVLSCADKISEGINEFYTQNQIDTGGGLMISADDMLPIFCFVLLKAKIDNLISHLRLIQTFSSDEDLTLAQTGYYFNVLCSAIQYLFNLEQTESPPTFGDPNRLMI